MTSLINNNDTPTPPLIDPSLLAKLSESERAEALAAAAAAQRAERRAEERARQRAAAAAAATVAADNGSRKNESGGANKPPALTEEEEEQRLLAEAVERRRKERERERELEHRRLMGGNGNRVANGMIGVGGTIANGGMAGGGGGRTLGAGAGGSGMRFVSKKKRGASSIYPVSASTAEDEEEETTNGKYYIRTTKSSSPKRKAPGNNNHNGRRGNTTSTTTQRSNHEDDESHLTASQLASIKKAYLGEKAVLLSEEPPAAASASSYTNSGRNNHHHNNGRFHHHHASSSSSSAANQSIRQRLREQRQKRRVKKTTFKFEWGAEEDTFEDDDPLYGGALLKYTSSRMNQNGSGSAYRPTSVGGVGGGGGSGRGGGGSSGITGRPRNNNARQQPTTTPSGSGMGMGIPKFGFGGTTKRKTTMRLSDRDDVTAVHSVTNKPLSKMTPRDWRIYRENYNIVVKGGKSPPPLRSFRETPVGVAPIHPSLIDAIENTLRYTKPSPIQRQAIPIGMQRRDLIGIAETGSGKTAAFGVPLCHHVLSFPPEILETVAEEGPLALVMAPTRELALQINVEFGKLLSSQKDVVSLAVVGGQSITEQATKLRNGVHVVVGTPGRINDCVEMAYLVLNQCSYIVLDEADRMIDLGFAPQIEQILDAMGGKLKSEDETEAYRQEREDLERLGKAVPSHRLTAMFSATMPNEVERIAKRYLRHPVVVSVGDRDSGKNARITQRVLFLSSPGQKEGALRDILRRSHPREKIIVFVNEKKHADGVGRTVENAGRQCVVLHGGKTQDQREENLALFRRGGVVLVATDVAGRGLDIPDVQQVINYDLPTRSIDNYCHRIGRTGRAGKEGLATSFITDEDEGIMAPLRQYLESTGMQVPDRLARHPAAVGGAGEFIR